MIMATDRIRRILCPIDFSETSVHAVEHAVALARWLDARLIALHVYAPIFAPIPSLPDVSDRVPDAEIHAARDRTCTFVKAAGGSGLTVDVQVEVGHPAPTILARASALPADLIVMGTHGASGIERLIIGSVAEKVLRRASCPVLTVPPRVRSTSRIPFARVMCAVDFSEWSSAAVELAGRLATAAGAELDLVHVIEWPWDEPPPPDFAGMPREQASALAEFRRYVTSRAEARLASIASDVSQGRGAVRVHVSHGKPYAGILRIAAVEAADVIVLGVHGRNPIDLTLFGSTTNHVVRQATCPVLTVRR
jgi:nucleotide-binding universal stress UspA family protein